MTTHAIITRCGIARYDQHFTSITFCNCLLIQYSFFWPLPPTPLHPLRTHGGPNRYGALPNETAFPMRVFDSWVLNQGYYMQAGLGSGPGSRPIKDPAAGLQPGDLFQSIQGYGIYHDKWEPIPNNTWVEVAHSVLPTELTGAWVRPAGRLMPHACTHKQAREYQSILILFSHLPPPRSVRSIATRCNPPLCF